MSERDPLRGRAYDGRRRFGGPPGWARNLQPMLAGAANAVTAGTHAGSGVGGMLGPHRAIALEEGANRVTCAPTTTRREDFRYDAADRQGDAT